MAKGIAAGMGNAKRICLQRGPSRTFEQGLQSEANAAFLQDRASLPSAFAQVLPDFAVRMAAFYLDSLSIGALMCTDVACQGALSMPGLVAELMCMRGFSKVGAKATSFAQLHLGERLLTEENNISFEFMCTDLSQRGQKVLDNVADLFRRHPDASGRIEAHAQPGAPPSIAAQICGARAQAVRTELTSRGVESSRLRLGGFGTSRPLLGLSDEANRRAEIFMILGDIQFPPEHMPVRVDNSAKWAAWLRGESIGIALDELARIVSTDSDEEDEERDLARLFGGRFPTGSTHVTGTSSDDDQDAQDSDAQDSEVEDGTSSSDEGAIETAEEELLREIALT